jgi:hypothetical protein
MRIFKCIVYIILLLFCSKIQGQTADTSKPIPKTREQTDHQLAFSFDVSQPIINAAISYRQGYEFAIDYYLKKELYASLEGGFGSATVGYDNLKYTSNNSFVRGGVSRCILTRLSASDWDAAFIGARLGVGFINRSKATFHVDDTLWGRTLDATSAAQSFTGYWFELTAGMRVELVKHFFVGYIVRGKFLLNTSAFQELAPIYVAGYGRGDKNAVFDFNFYVTYALRWKRKNIPLK